MRRFMMIAVIMWISSAALMGLFLITGRYQPWSEAIRQFSMNNCAAPCIAGVRFGQTTFDDAKRTLSELLAMPGYSLHTTVVEQAKDSAINLTLSNSAADRTTAYFYFVGGVAQSGSLYVDYSSAQTPPLAEVVALYGLPFCAYKYNDAKGNPIEILYIVDKTRGLTVRIDGNYPMNWNSQIRHIWIGKDPPFRLCACSRWRGIRDVRLGLGICADNE